MPEHQVVLRFQNQHHWQVSLESFFSRTSPLTNRSAKILQVTSPSWPIASRCRCFTPVSAGASLVSFSDRSFRGPVRSRIVPRKILGDIVVLQHCPNIKEFDGSNTSITGKFLSDRSLSGPVRSQIVPRKILRGTSLRKLPPDFTQLLFFSSGDKTAIQRALPKCSIVL